MHSRVFYQTFEVTASKKKAKKVVDHDSLSQLSVHLHATRSRQLSSTLRVLYVANVACEPDQLTIFNHPSNVVTLRLSNGSGHYRAHIDALQQQQQQQQDKGAIAQPASSANAILKVNQISESALIVSPIASNGLANVLM